MEDSASIRKTEEERKEDEELAERVNATLAAEEAEKKKEEDERKKRDQEKIKKEKEKKKQDKSVGKQVDQEGVQDEAGPSLNCSCPTEESCEPYEDCPVANCSGQGEACPEVKPCPKCKDPEEPEKCPPVLPCPGVNTSSGNLDLPPSVVCPEADVASLSVPVALAIGAIAGLLAAGVATAIGLILRYFSPFVSGFIFLATIILIWYLCSQYPETARELGGRAANLLREAAVALGHRVMAAVQRHTEQVSVSVKSNFFFLE